MNETTLETRRLKLILDSPDDVRAGINGMTAAERAELSADWVNKMVTNERRDNGAAKHCRYPQPWSSLPPRSKPREV